MLNNTRELVDKIVEMLNENGFIEPNFLYEFAENRHLVRKIDDRSTARYTISVKTVYRHNGAEENKSVDITVYSKKGCMYHKITGERTNIKMTDRQIANRVKKIIRLFNENAL